MAPSRNTWIVIIVITLGVGVMALFVVAGAGMYFVTKHIQTEHATTSDASRAFETERAPFKDQKPLIELDANERPRYVRSLSDLPRSQVKPQNLRILVFDPDEGRLVRLALPFWILRLGKRKIDIADHSSGFDFDRLQLDVNELERIGPALVLEHRTPSGERVLIWTQ